LGKSPGAASAEALEVNIEIGALCADFFKLSNCFRQALRFAIKTLVELNKKRSVCAMRTLITILFLMCASVSASVSANQPNKLWYAKPAAAWEEALPLGNGRLGAMVYGNPANDSIK
jgi:alpha-L-fucosidase 2